MMGDFTRLARHRKTSKRRPGLARKAANSLWITAAPTVVSEVFLEGSLLFDYHLINTVVA